MIDAVDSLLERALARGAKAAEVYAEQSATHRVKVFRGAVEELTAARRKGVGLRVFQDGSVGYAYTSDLSDESLDEVVATALANARVADHDPDSVLPAPRDEPAAVDVFDPGLEQATDEQRIELALAVEAAALAADPRVKSVDESVYADGDAQVFLANSGGVRGSFREGHCYAYAYVLGEQDGQIETGLSFTVGRKPADLDPQACGAEAATRAVELLGATKSKTIKTTVVLDPFVAASFFGVLSSALTAEAVQKGRSLFAGRVGEQVAGPGVTLTDDGIHPDGLASAPFDGEGVPCRRTPLIADGVLQGFLYNVRSGHRDGRESTGNGARGSYQTMPGVGPTNLVLSGPQVPARRAHRRHRVRRAGDQRHRHPLGRQPGLGRVLGGHQRAAHRSGPRHQAGARGHHGRRHRLHAAQHRGAGRRRPLGAERQHPHAVGGHRRSLDRRRLTAPPSHRARAAAPAGSRAADNGTTGETT